MLIVKVKPSKYIFSFKPCGSINKVPSCNLQTKCNFELCIVIGNNISLYQNLLYTHGMYYPMFIELSCAVVYFEGLWSNAVVNLKNLFIFVSSLFFLSFWLCAILQYVDMM